MNILFIVSGNSSNFEIAPFIKRQADSIERMNQNVNFYRVKEKGLIGYLRNVKHLRKHIINNHYDILHAHYTFNGLLALLTFTKHPIIVSYMGSDTYGDYNNRGKRRFLSNVNVIISKIIQPFIQAIIVKSPNLQKYIYCKKKLNLIPNGVDMDYFIPGDRDISRERLGIKYYASAILFLGNPEEPRKNFTLLKEALNVINDKQIVLLNPFPVAPFEILDYYLSADIFVLSSYNEGSPNVVKEAMACNCPIVSTNVGDVDWLLGEITGHFITSFDTINMSEKIMQALQFAKEIGRTNGRDRIIELGLDSETVANRIIEVYNKVLKSK